MEEPQTLPTPLGDYQYHKTEKSSNNTPNTDPISNWRHQEALTTATPITAPSLSAASASRRVSALLQPPQTSSSQTQQHDWEDESDSGSFLSLRIEADKPSLANGRNTSSVAFRRLWKQPQSPKKSFTSEDGGTKSVTVPSTKFRQHPRKSLSTFLSRAIPVVITKPEQPKSRTVAFPPLDFMPTCQPSLYESGTVDKSSNGDRGGCFFRFLSCGPLPEALTDKKCRNEVAGSNSNVHQTTSTGSTMTEQIQSLPSTLFRQWLHEERQSEGINQERDAAASAPDEPESPSASLLPPSPKSLIALEVVKLRKELNKRRQQQTSSPSRRPSVHFANPLVTDTQYRPYTDPADVPNLYFVEEELYTLECDRRMVDDDQFEVVVAVTEPRPEERKLQRKLKYRKNRNQKSEPVVPASESNAVQIAHQKRRLLALDMHSSLPHSLSDLSLL